MKKPAVQQPPASSANRNNILIQQAPPPQLMAEPPSLAPAELVMSSAKSMPKRSIDVKIDNAEYSKSYFATYKKCSAKLVGTKLEIFKHLKQVGLLLKFFAKILY